MKQKLELTWVGKDVRPRLEPRVLLETPELSFTAPARVSENDLFDNRLIFGDNLLALKALEQELTGKVKCIFIDPPYNTGSAFEHYDDGLEHSLWLSMMRDRLEILKTMLSDDGSIWITIDDNEMPYLKVLADEVFGRQNFINTVIWQKNFAPKSSARFLSSDHDYILIYAKDNNKWQRNLLPRSVELDSRYKNPDNDARGPWASDNLTARNYYSLGSYSITTPVGEVISGPPKGTYWRFSEESFRRLNAENRIWWGKDGKGTPRLKRFLSDVQAGVVPQTMWFHTEVGNTQEAKKEVLHLTELDTEVFGTPKPERLVKRILDIATNPGDLVLDSFAGSGTTGAVAHKMGRRWVMIELQDTAHTHIIPRLKKVIDGTDQGGISSAVGWKGGGGFRYYHLAPTLIVRDARGFPIINPQHNPEMLAEAVCKLEGFTYAPANTQAEYWMHGYSTERDFIFVTTRHMTQNELTLLSDEVGDERTLLILCAAFNTDADAFSNLTIKKIPQALLHKCEWGKDDYSLKVQNLPAHSDAQPREPPPARRARAAPAGAVSLFEDNSGQA